MTQKRRDNKKRILRDGESQRKDGRYVFKYTDSSGRAYFLYSWKLEKTDVMPQGKRKDISLREKEAAFLKDIQDNIIPSGGETTVLELVKRYVEQKVTVRHNTKTGYNFVLNILKGYVTTNS